MPSDAGSEYVRQYWFGMRFERDPSAFIAAVSGGWPKVVSNLKSLLETGAIVMQDPYPTSDPHGRPQAGA